MNMLNRENNLEKQHKWLGIGMSFFILMFCLCRVFLLNHRSLIKDVDVKVSGNICQVASEFKNWNGGLLRGTLCFG